MPVVHNRQQTMPYYIEYRLHWCWSWYAKTDTHNTIRDHTPQLSIDQETEFPEGSPGCATDVYIAAKVSPGVDFMDVVQRRKDDPVYLVAFDGAKAYFVDNEMEIPDFNPSSSVVGETEYSFLDPMFWKRRGTRLIRTITARPSTTILN